MYRRLYCNDSLTWLAGKQFKAIITSLPDMSELGCTAVKYTDWLDAAAKVLAAATATDGCIIFYQTNRKYKGALVDKDFLISQVFYAAGFKKIFHKIVLRKEPGKKDLYRPTYSNMFCFGKEIASGPVAPDVLYAGTMLHPNGMGLNACAAAIGFVQQTIDTDTILDPFCGTGSVLATANKNGYHAIGIDIDPEKIALAKILTLPPDQ